MLNNIPCIKDKCILLPICKTKQIINCNNICIFLSSLFIHDNFIEQYHRIKTEVFQIFENTSSIEGRINGNIFYIRNMGMKGILYDNEENPLY